MLVWMWILDHAMWEKGARVRFNDEIIELNDGQLTCGSLQISMETGCAPSTISRVINDLVRESLIERRIDSKCSLITVKNWGIYQGNKSLNENLSRGEREASEKQVRTKKEIKNIRNKEDNYICRPETESFFEWLSQRCKELNIENKTKIKAIDIFIVRYLNKVRFRQEMDGYLAWMIDTNKRVLRSSAVGNCFKRQATYNKKMELRQMENKQANHDPILKDRIKERGESTPKQDMPFKIDPNLKERLSTLAT